MLKNQNNFAPFIDENTTLEKYCDWMGKNGVWGGQMELNALAYEFKFNVIVHKIDSPSMAHVFHEPMGSVPTIHLSYHMGSHYNSVRRADDPCRIGDPPIKKYVIGHKLAEMQKEMTENIEEPKSKIRKVVNFNNDDDEETASTSS